MEVREEAEDPPVEGLDDRGLPAAGRRILKEFSLKRTGRPVHRQEPSVFSEKLTK